MTRKCLETTLPQTHESPCKAIEKLNARVRTAATDWHRSWRATERCYVHLTLSLRRSRYVR